MQLLSVRIREELEEGVLEGILEAVELVVGLVVGEGVGRCDMCLSDFFGPNESHIGITLYFVILSNLFYYGIL